MARPSKLTSEVEARIVEAVELGEDARRGVARRRLRGKPVTVNARA